MKLLTCWVMYGVALLWFVPHAQAATAQPPTGAKKQTVPAKADSPILLSSIQKLHQQGRRLFERKQYTKALSMYEKAYTQLLQLEKTTTQKTKRLQAQRYRKSYLATLGAAYHWRKDFLQARFYYAKCVAENKARLQKLCRKYLSIVTKQLARIKISTTPKHSTLKVRAIKTPGKAPFKLWTPGGKAGVYWLGKGTFLVEIVHPGYVSLWKRLTVKAGSRATFHYKLRKPNCPPSPTAQARLVAPRPDELILNTPDGFLVPETMPQSLDTKVMQTSPGQPLPSTGWPVWKTAAVVSGVVVAAGLLAAGGYAIYRANNNVYQWQPGQP